MIKNISMYFSFFKASIKTLLEYRMDTMIGIGSQLLMQSIELIFIWIIFQNTQTLGGWTNKELLLLYGMMAFSISVVDLLTDNFYEIGPKYIKEGDFDQILLRPVHPIIYVMGCSKSVTSFAYMLLGLILIITMLIQLQIAITFTLIAKIIFFTIIGGGIIAGIIVAFSTVSFWSHKANEVIWTGYRMYTLAQYPIQIYNTVIRVLITCILPFAFVAYFPLSNILNKDNTYLAYLAPIVMIIVWIIGVKIWNWGLKHYSSTGN